MRSTNCLAALLIMMWGCGDSEPTRPVVEIDLPPGGVVFGSASAPVTVLDISSFDCPACSILHTSVLPQVLEPYLQAGKVRVRFIDTSQSEIGRRLSTLVECATSERPDFALIGQAFSTGQVETHSSSSCPESESRPARVRAEEAALGRAGATGTPVLIIGFQEEGGRLVGWPLIGVPEPSELRTLLDSAAHLLGTE